MQISILLMKQILELFLMILMGYIIVKTGLLKDEDSKVISKIVLYLIIPCVIINAFQVEYTDDKVKGLFLALVASVLLQVLLLLIVWGIGRVFHMNPMVEALRDFEAGKCGNGDNCFVEISDLAEYKNVSSRNSLNPHFRDYNIDVWKEIVDVFSMRISCLLGNAEVISYEQYLDEANPHDIFMCEQALAGNNKVFIISAFPEFLVDYFGMKLWRTCVKHAKNQLDICNCK